MIDSPPPNEPMDELRSAIEADDAEAAESFLEEISPSESALAVTRLDEDDQANLVKMLPPNSAASLLEELPDSESAAIVGRLATDDAAEILDVVTSDAQADILGRLPEHDAEAILREMIPSEAEDARRLMQYEPETAGGLMVSEYLRYRSDLTVEQVLDDLRHNADEYRKYDIQYAYVISAADDLVGVLRLRDVLLADRAQSLGEVMITDPLRVNVDESLLELVGFFDRNHFLGVPVVEKDGKLVGVVRQNDVREAALESADRTLLKLTGIAGGEELRTMPIGVRSKRRLSWLSINIVLNIVAASVIAMYQETLEAVIALAVFLPIISDMSGCSGNQAVAVSMRELSLGLIRPSEYLRVLWKESSVGVINGVVLGLLLGVVAMVWKSSLALGAVVAIALLGNTVIAVCIGGSVPLLLKGLNQDPALASGPILTTITDMCGFFLVLSLATLMLPWLIG